MVIFGLVLGTNCTRQASCAQLCSKWQKSIGVRKVYNLAHYILYGLVKRMPTLGTGGTVWQTKRNWAKTAHCTSLGLVPIHTYTQKH